MVKVERCRWCEGDDDYIAYHDQEWGVPVHDDVALFERLCLEGMQAGLSWLTILKKRAHMTATFHGFDPVRLARAGDEEIGGWLTDPGVIRHRGKLAMLRTNARAFLALPDPVETFWQFAPETQHNCWETSDLVPSTTPESQSMAKALKRLGFTFVGPTICYAFMQSVGMVNDHVVGCFRHAELARDGGGSPIRAAHHPRRTVPGP